MSSSDIHFLLKLNRGFAANSLEQRRDATWGLSYAECSDWLSCSAAYRAYVEAFIGIVVAARRMLHPHHEP